MTAVIENTLISLIELIYICEIQKKTKQIRKNKQQSTPYSVINEAESILAWAIFEVPKGIVTVAWKRETRI